MTETISKPTACPACKRPFAERNGTFTYASGTTICYDCHTAATPKRLQRWGSLPHSDFMQKMHREMREAVEERNRYRREVDAVRSEVHNEFRRLSFWKRLRLLFSPFG